MSLLAFDLGGTKLATAIFNNEGKILFREITPLEKRKGHEVGKLITNRISTLSDVTEITGGEIKSIGISVPGIYYSKQGTVWAPNIQGWKEYPLLSEIQSVAGKIPVTIDSDRACYILGEVWKGNAQQCKDAIFLSVGTGIGAGILVNGNVLRGSNDIAGAIGWMGIQRPFDKKYIECGCLEYYTSGEGIAKMAKELLKEQKNYSGELKNKSIEEISSLTIFRLYEKKDEIAEAVIQLCIKYWGIAAANLVSLFNPEKIIFGGGVFGPAISLLPNIKEEATKWAQPISIQQVSFEASSLRNDAGVYGAAFLALSKLNS
ncbi:MAG TPA: ROK family protein [Hanamia sp.]